MGCKNDIQENPEDIGVNPGLGLGATSGLELYKEILDYYSTLHFIKADGSYNLETVVNYTTNILLKHGLINTNETQECAGIWIYPKDYFCPKKPGSLELEMTNNTHTIHHFNGSWVTTQMKVNRKIEQIIGSKLTAYIKKIISN